MVFSHRIAALAAVVAIPLGIAVTSYALTDSPDDRKVPPKVELESGSPTGPPSSPPPVPRDETVAPPAVSENPSGVQPSGANPGGGNTPAPPTPKHPTSPPVNSGDDDDNGQGDDGPGGDDFGDDG